MSSTLKNRIHKTLATAAVAAVLLAVQAQAQIRNGQFEQGGSNIAPPRWTEVGGVRQNPPEGAGLGGPGNNSAVISYGVGIPLSPGVRGAAIGQDFACGPVNPNGFCFIRFVYLYDEQPPQSQSKAFVYLDGPAGEKIVELPDNTPPGPGPVQIAYPSCGPMKIKIGLIETSFDGPIQSTLLVDKVTAKCDNQPWPNTPVLELHDYVGNGGATETLLKELCKKMGPWQDLGYGCAGFGGLVPVLDGIGSVTPGTASAISLTDALPNAPGLMIVGLNDIYAPVLGCTLVPSPNALFSFMTGGNGDYAVSFSSDVMINALGGNDVFFQVFVQDPAASFGYAASNGLMADL